MIVIVDYGCGNLCSLRNAFVEVGAKAVASDSPKVIAGAEKVVLPGVGSFGTAMKRIKQKGLGKPIMLAAAKKPFLGICLGMQLLFEESEESPGMGGLGLLQGKVKRFSVSEKVPQMGWNRVNSAKQGGLFEGLPDGAWFFFANSFFAKPANSTVVAGKSFYGEEFCAAVEKENVWATQFHPEKSGGFGLKMLWNFAKKRGEEK